MKINTIDLFAGCGGLCEGFEQSGNYNILACVEWEKAPCNNLKKHLAEKWGYHNADEIVLRFDIQRTSELFDGWNDGAYGVSQGLNAILQGKIIDMIIGGPPCQAYSIAGRIRDKNGMRDDYRNFLFESYIRVVKQYKPKAFIFENVPGILSATPMGTPIIETIKKSFYDAGYTILGDLGKAVIDLTEYGVPQKRNRIIILGLSNDVYGENVEILLQKFYNKILPTYKEQVMRTVRDAIGDLPKLYPTKKSQDNGRKRYSHTVAITNIPNHEPRWHSERDQKIFKLLASDIENGVYKYTSTTALKQLYTDITGKKSNVHKYYVLRWDEPSNLIPAHLYKDGLRHIHPDSEQARSITVREAARLQGFPDDYEFIGTQADAYKMIGNAVPPIFSKKLACAVKDLLFTEE
ncbi:MAG: DNA cytosine methyltransferase [Clostridia bacterium]|nr:DNA cytosine methyltransferase [Clostridia bacterium]